MTMQLPDVLRLRLLRWAESQHLQARSCDFLIHNAAGPYLARWYVVRQGKRWLRLTPEQRQHHLDVNDPRSDGGGRNVFVHQFLSSDDERALHDHPWRWLTIILSGQYLEHVPADPSNPAGATTVHHRREGDVVWCRRSQRAHRIEVIDGERAITLFLTGRKTREWGFHCRQGWRHWRDFTALDGNGRSRGCN